MKRPKFSPAWPCLCPYWSSMNPAPTCWRPLSTPPIPTPSPLLRKPLSAWVEPPWAPLLIMIRLQGQWGRTRQSQLEMRQQVPSSSVDPRGASLVAQLIKNLPKKKKKRICLQCRRPGFNPWVGKIPWRRERLATPVFWLGEFHGL